MQEEQFSLKTILDTLTKVKNSKVKKRLIYDQAPLKGIGAKWVIAFFFSLPVMLYAGIFNDWMFSKLGIAQAIIFFIVFLSMVMILVIAVTFINNNKVLRQIDPSWKNYFPDVEIKWILTSGVSPYKEFFAYYSEALEKGLEGDDLYHFMQDSFESMKSDNADLVEAMSHSREKPKHQ
ncbi:MAG: hypothetical protein GQ531_07660 [Sulfurovum sp.]|nr:hypothetical protein [Sulfurovum sp.]